MSDIYKNLDALNEKIADVCKECGRSRDDVLLIAVTKTRTAEEINEAISWGITDIGENKVQEITDKYEKVHPVKWHMIGHLQTNKVKYIIDKVSLIHSVDSVRLAEEINKRAGEKGLTAEILIQINAAEEESKFGIDKAGFESLLETITEQFEHIKIKGLMTIAPYDPDPENVRIYFRQVKEIFDHYRDIHNDRMDFQHLSMGMSGDYEVAIQEGATMVRIGTAIFGVRNYQI